MQNVKCVVVGDGGVGKTCLLVSYSTNAFPGEYIPTVFDSYSKAVITENLPPINLHLWDTAGQEDYRKLRPLAYPQTDVFLVCFSLTDRTSFQNVESTWVPEICEYCPKTPFVIVGLKKDLRDVSGGVSVDEGNSLAKKVNANCYVECSSLKSWNVDDVFESAMKLAIFSQSQLGVITEDEKEKERCCILI